MLDGTYPLWQCQACDTLFTDPQPDDHVLADIYSKDYFLGGNSKSDQDRRREMKEGTAQIILGELETYRGAVGGRLLEIGCGQGELLSQAEAVGYDVTGIDYSEHAVKVAQSHIRRGRVFVGEIESLAEPDHSFDIVVALDTIEHVRDPRRFIEHVHRLLAPGGILLLTTISINTWTARHLKHAWMEFKTEHLVYFSNKSLFSLMLLSGFREIRLSPTYKILSPKYVLDHFERYRIPILTPLLRLGYQILPAFLRHKTLRLTGSTVLVISKAMPRRPTTKLSIIMPVYNEAKTFETIIDQVLDLKLSGLEKEVIIVESNSSDGTREQVLRYQNLATVKIILQDRARGKGDAVREGFKHATGDFVLIQDADLEYDVNDYDKLLSELINFRAHFVLGSRHTGDWKIRKFTQQPAVSLYFNLGHQIFRGLLNLLYGQHLDDPFTMYKVFWRDCLYGLSFECNRFDFDFELVIKLIRKGYRPLEIPVNYVARSLNEGKKVSAFRDPWTWIRALIKFRFVPLKLDQ